jgi:hypothetical protein
MQRFEEGLKIMPSDNFWRYFYEIYEALPRQGPGDRESTLQALGLLPTLTREQRNLDIGCGAGAPSSLSVLRKGWLRGGACSHRAGLWSSPNSAGCAKTRRRPF